jgi:hypothetical protein
MDPITGVILAGAILKLGSGVANAVFGDAAQGRSMKEMAEYLDAQPEVYRQQMAEKLKNLEANSGNVQKANIALQDIADYNKSFQAGQYAVGPKKEWKDTFTTEQFLNPYLVQKKKENEEALARANVRSGGLYSGGTGLAMLEKSNEVTADDWLQAVQQKTTERQFDYTKDRQDYADIIAQADRNLELWKTGGLVKQSTANAYGGIVTNTGKEIQAKNNALQTYFDSLNANSNDKAKLAALKAGNLPMWQKILTGTMNAGGDVADVMSQVMASNPSKTYDVGDSGVATTTGSSYAAMGMKPYTGASGVDNPSMDPEAYNFNYPAATRTDLGGSQTYTPTNRQTTNLGTQYTP